MHVSRVPDEAAWAIRWRDNLYVVAIDAEGLPAQRYWGRLLPERDWPVLAQGLGPRWHTSSSRPTEAEEEMLPRGGLRWGVAGIALRWPSGDEELSPIFVADDVEDDGEGLRLSFADSVHPALRIDLCYLAGEASDVLERWVELHLHQDFADPVLVDRLDSANWLIPEQADYRVSHVSGHWGSENLLHRETVPHGEFTLGSRTGTTSHHTNPWVMVDDGSASETHGTVRTVGLAWSGSWRMDLQRRPEGSVSVTAGAGQEVARRVVRPGETVRTAVSYGVVTHAGFGSASRAMHQYADLLAPQPSRTRPVLYNSWEATEFDISMSGQLELAGLAAEIGVELFVVDDGWFGTRTDETRGLGDWSPNPDRFPGGLGPLVEGVRGLGLMFGLWVEPEMVNADSLLYTARPDWVLHFTDRDRRELRNQLVLNFARDDVREWATDWLVRLVVDHDLDFLKWDMNRPFAQAGWPANAEHQGSLWFEHVEGVYAVMLALRAAKPDLLLESCSGGGGRVDLAMARLADWFWTSDNTDALDRQRIQHGFSQVYPAKTMMNWVTDSPNAITGRRVPLDYRFHVAMAGALGIGGDLTAWTSEDRARAKELIALYKSVREVVQLGQAYRLGGRPGEGWSALQFVRGDRAAVIGYQPHRSLDNGCRLVPLQGLDPAADYEIGDTGQVLSGEALVTRGFELFADVLRSPRNGTLQFSAPDYLSVVVELRRATHPRD
jgi:alpha-galactosidase